MRQGERSEGKEFNDMRAKDKRVKGKEDEGPRAVWALERPPSADLRYHFEASR